MRNALLLLLLCLPVACAGGSSVDDAWLPTADSADSDLTPDGSLPEDAQADLSGDLLSEVELVFDVVVEL